MASLRNVIIVRANIGNDAGSRVRWQSNYAAQELSKYLSRMCGESVRVVDSAPDSGRRCIIAVGNAEENSVTRRLVDDGALDLSIPSAGGDGFAIHSAKDKDHAYLVLAGETSVSTLYAVYDYLERFCHIGFFMDGEYVPTCNRIPFSGLDFTSKPRFAWRHFCGTNCQIYGLRKYGCLFRRQQDWEDYLGWMVRRKLNFSSFAMGSGFKFSGKAPMLAFGINKEPVEEAYNGGWPLAWAYPQQYMTSLTRRVLKYGRDRGVKFFYGLGYGDVPYYINRFHTEYKWITHGYESQPVLHPDDPISYDLTKRYTQAVVGLFGTDHVYFDMPFGEVTGAATTDESLRLKTEAAKKDVRLFKEVDPKAVWLADTWDMNCFSDSVWTPKNVNSFLNNFGAEDMFVFDVVGDLRDRFYKTNGYFFGKKWAFGILHSFQGDDHLHGDIDRTISKTKEAVSDSESTDLDGFGQVPETIGHNILYWQLTTELSWDPLGVEKDNFLRKYALTRYGKESAPVMEKALRKLVAAVYSKDYPELQMIYKKIGAKRGSYVRSYPIVDDNAESLSFYSATLPGIMNDLRESIDIALTQEDAQANNRLYENDMVAMVKNYLGFCFNYSVTRAYLAFKAGDKVEFEAECAKSLQALNGIRDILSTRQDYHLQVQIDEIESTPGHNPYAVKMLRRGAVNDCYSANDVYELVCCHYIPRFEIWRNTVQEKLVAGDPTLTHDDLTGSFEKQLSDYVENDFDISRLVKYPGTTMRAIIDYYSRFRKDGPR